MTTKIESVQGKGTTAFCVGGMTSHSELYLEKEKEESQERRIHQESTTTIEGSQREMGNKTRDRRCAAPDRGELFEGKRRLGERGRHYFEAWG